MSASTGNATNDGLDARGRRRIVQVTFNVLFGAGLYFISAGRLDLLWGWVYLGVSFVSFVVGGLYVTRHNPQTINERGRPAEAQKGWDRRLMMVYLRAYLVLFIVPGLDARFAWTGSLPVWLHLLGVGLLIFSAFLTYSAMAHNKFLAQVVQVVVERGHQVATSGPYRYVRHPMYVAIIISSFGQAFLYGSCWTLIPAVLVSLLLVVRTALEDRTLHQELPGYADYARQTRYRLLPWVW